MRSLALLLLPLVLAASSCRFDEGGTSVASNGDGAPRGDTTGDGPITRVDGARDVDDAALPTDSSRDSGDGSPTSDSTRDTTAPADSTRDTVAPGDSTRDTAPPPDSSVDSGPPVYVNAQFTSGTGGLSSIAGNWTVTGGRAVQIDTNVNGASFAAPISAADYIVETSLRIHGLRGSALGEGAGVGARISGTNVPPRGYICILSPDVGVIALLFSDGSSASIPALGTSPATVQLNTDYVVRLRVSGNQITCSSPTLNVSVTRTHNGATQGGRAGLVTMLVHASFDYLTVTGL